MITAVCMYKLGLCTHTGIRTFLQRPLMCHLCVSWDANTFECLVFTHGMLQNVCFENGARLPMFLQCLFGK